MIEIIAEVGVNHQNDIAIAEKLIQAAAISGATTVKFQCSTVEEEVSYRVAPEHFHELAMLVPTTTFLKECRDLCVKYGVGFLCTPSGPRSLKVLVEQLEVKRLKIASDNLTNVQFLQLVSRTGLPVILSTGMGTLQEIDTALYTMGDRSDVTLMHCVSAYPAPVEQTNLRAIHALKTFERPVGFSDHSRGILLAPMAVAFGAVVIEKHITLDRNMPGPDHAASITPMEFRQMVLGIQVAEAARGSGIKEPQPCEATGISRYRKSLVADQPIKAGEVLGDHNVIAKRPGNGVPAAQWFAYRGMVARRDYEQDEQIDP